MENPKVSIIIPVYNGSNYMQCAIDCALNQTYANTEVLVINDGSKDEGKTDEIARSYGDRIRYISKSNGGVSSALNCGIANMTGDYFAWLSHDDAYTPTRIEDAVNLLKAHGLLGKKYVGFTGGYVADANGTRLKELRNCFEKDRIYSGYEAMERMAETGTLYGCSFLIPRRAFDEAGCFDESLRYSQDTLMWYRIFLAGYGIVSDDHPNVMSRMHGSQVSHLRRDLFSHDALVIAKLLAQPLSQADESGKLIRKYMKRLTRYECSEAVSYLYNYAGANGYLNFRDRIQIQMLRISGFFRCRAAAAAKKILLRFRH